MTEEHPSRSSVHIDLAPEETAFVRRQINDGRYASAEDMLRAGLRLLARDERQQRVAELRLMIDEADASVEAGDSIEFSGTGDLTAHVIAKAKARK